MDKIFKIFEFIYPLPRVRGILYEQQLIRFTEQKADPESDENTIDFRLSETERRRGRHCLG